MKTMKKVFAVLMAVAMLLAMSATAFAAGETGTITIGNAEKDNVYSAYKLLDLSYEDHGTESTTDDGYVYYLPEDTAAADWYDFLTGTGIKDGYINVDKNGIVTWKDGADAKTFAEAALAYAKENKDSIVPVSTATATGVTLTLNADGPGYYLVDSSLGALVVLTTATPNVTIKEKNETPTIEKKVLEIAEDGTETWEDLNRVEAGDQIFYRVIINAKTGAQNYVLHDLMDVAHMSYAEDITVYLNDDGSKDEAKKVDASKYTVHAENGEDCTFEVEFQNEFLAGLGNDDVLTVYYSAYFVGTVEAVVNAPHTNTAWLTYGDDNETVEDVVQTVSYGLEVLKYANGNMSLRLGGAEFKLYRDSDCTDVVYVHPVDMTADGKQVYTVCNHVDTHKDEEDKPTTTIVTPEGTGAVLVYGVDLETYYLVETKAPAGYNPLNEAVEVAVNTGNMGDNRIFGVNVNNNTGSILPDTGGIGTTIFYAIGAVLVLGAVVILVAKKRMATEK